LKNSHTISKILVLLTTSLILTVLCPFFGINWFGLRDIFSHDMNAHIFFNIRLPRTIAAFTGGGTLAIGGMVCQALFRNPLASPYTLGISAGASLGAALCIALGITGSFVSFSFVSLGAFTGAIGAIAIVFFFAWQRESNSTTLLLAGVIISTVCSGLIWFAHYLSPLQHSYQITRWIMGGVDGITYTLLTIILIPATLYGIIIGILLPQLDQFLTGDALAHSRGINVQRSRITFILLTAFAVGAIVSVCGPIGFVGIMAPHACRMLLPGIRHRLLALCSFFLGGAFLTVSDTLARTINPPSEIPVGIITALCGGPFFLAILFKRKGHLHL